MTTAVLDTVGVGFLAPMPTLSGVLKGDQEAAWRVQLAGPDLDTLNPARAVLNGSTVQLTWHAKPPTGMSADRDVGFLVARASLPKLRYGSNYRELHWEDAESAFAELVELAAGAAGLPTPPAEEVYINRVDLTRNENRRTDQAVESQIRKLAAAGRLLVPGRWKFTFHRSHQLHGALTVVWQQQHRSLMVYDKHRESRTAEAAGLCRYEIRHQGRSVRRHLGIRTLDQVDAIRLNGQLEAYLMQVPSLGDEESLADRVLRASVELWGPTKGRLRALRLLGYMQGADNGEWDNLPAATARRYRADIRRLSTQLGTVAENV